MKFKLTDLGRVMEAQLIAGSKPIITRIEASDAYSSNDGALLSVQNKKQDLEIEEIAVVEGASHLKFVLHNVGLAEEYMLRQVGIYARQQEGTEEILYIIGQDKIGERVPAASEKLVEYEYDLMIHTENTYGAEVVVKGSYFATKEEIEEIKRKMVNADDGDISNTKLSVFDDFEIEGEEQPGEESVEVPAAREAIKKIKKGNKLSVIISNIKAALMGLVTLGEMRGLLVNNGLCTEPGKFFLDAAYGKNLQDQLTKLNSDLHRTSSKHGEVAAVYNNLAEICSLQLNPGFYFVFARAEIDISIPDANLTVQLGYKIGNKSYGIVNARTNCDMGGGCFVCWVIQSTTDDTSAILCAATNSSKFYKFVGDIWAIYLK